MRSLRKKRDFGFTVQCICWLKFRQLFAIIMKRCFSMTSTLLSPLPFHLPLFQLLLLHLHLTSVLSEFEQDCHLHVLFPCVRAVQQQPPRALLQRLSLKASQVARCGEETRLSRRHHQCLGIWRRDHDLSGRSYCKVRPGRCLNLSVTHASVSRVWLSTVGRVYNFLIGGVAGVPSAASKLL